MSSWLAFPDHRWTPIGGSLSGSGSGEGPFGLSYAIDTTNPTFLNGRVSATILLTINRPIRAAGLVCRADGLRSFVAFYAVTDPAAPDQYSLRLAAFKYGTPISTIALPKPVSIESGRGHFALQFFSGDLRAQLTSGAKVYTLQHVMPEICFPGHAGVIRFYKSSVLVQNIHIEEIGTRPVLPESSQEEQKRAHKFTVFLSYATADKEAVRRVAAIFKTNGITYWMDEDQITFGDPIVSKIEQGLQDSRYVVVCLSDQQARSGWVRGEYGPILYREFSGQTSRRVIPLTLDGSKNAKSIPLLLSDKMSADLTNSTSFSAFLEFLKKPESG